MEFAFFGFDKKLVLQEMLEDLSDVENVFLSRTGKGNDVVKVDEHEPVQHVAENIIHQSPEHSRGVDETRYS